MSSRSFCENRRRAVELLRRAPHGRIEERGYTIVAGIPELRSCERSREDMLELRVHILAGRDLNTLLRSERSKLGDCRRGYRRIRGEGVECRRDADIRRHVSAN